MKKVQVPRNVAGSGNLGKNYKSPNRWQLLDTLTKKDKSPKTWLVLETFTKKERPRDN
jgi:hypothetical protein